MIDLKLWEIDTPGQLPNFIDTENIVMDKDNIRTIGYVRLNKYNNINTIMFQYYGGITNVEQFSVIKKLLPLVLIYNGINDITETEFETVINIPNLDDLIQHTSIIEYNQTEDIPGLNSLFKNKTLSQSKNINNLTGLSNININLKKLKYDNETGILTL